MLYVDAEGIVWAAHNTAGLSVWNPHTGEVNRYTEADGLLYITVYDIAPAADGSLWLGTYVGTNI